MKPVRVKVKGYQAIDELEFEVCGFTCITGRTNIGKSSIVRAISGAILNAPTVGKVRRSQKYATVEIESEGWGFKWEKGESVSRYWLPGEDKPKTALGQGQTEHTMAMGFRSVRVGQDNIHPWYASQHEPIFLLDQSGPSVTEFISEVSRLKVLQDAIGINVRAKESLLREAKAEDQKAEEAKSLLAPFHVLESLAGVPESLEAQLESIEEYQARVELGESLEADLESVQGSLAVLEAVERIDIKKGPSAVVASLETASGMLVGLEATAKTVIAVRPAESVPVPAAPEMGGLGMASEALRAEALRAEVQGMEAALEREVPKGPSEDLRRLREAAGILGPLESAQASLEVLRGAESAVVPAGPDDVKKLEDVVRLLQELEAAARLVGAAKNELESVEADLEAVTEELGRIPTCPTCKQVMPEDRCPEPEGRRTSP